MLSDTSILLTIHILLQQELTKMVHRVNVHLAKCKALSMKSMYHRRMNLYLTLAIVKVHLTLHSTSGQKLKSLHNLWRPKRKARRSRTTMPLGVKLSLFNNQVVVLQWNRSRSENRKLKELNLKVELDLEIVYINTIQCNKQTYENWNEVPNEK